MADHDGKSRPVLTTSASRLALLAKVARLYHEEGLLQPDIAERLAISQSSISRMLKEAEQMGIVRTIVRTPPGIFGELEHELRTRLALSDVVIADSAGDEAASLSSVGAAAANYLESAVRDGERIGVTSRSAALHAMIESLSPISVARASTVVQSLGAVGNSTMRAQATRFTDRLSQFTGGEPVYVSAPGVVRDRHVRDGLLDDPYIAEAAEAWSSLTMILTGIGTIGGTGTERSWGNALLPEDSLRLSELGAVGDICLNFFDSEGAAVDGGISDRVIGISAELLRRVPRRIGVAAGQHKVRAITAAARGGWINILATDRTTAELLVAE